MSNVTLITSETVVDDDVNDVRKEEIGRDTGVHLPSLFFRFVVPVILLVSSSFRYSMNSLLYLIAFLVHVARFAPRPDGAAGSTLARSMVIALILLSVCSLTAEALWNVLLATGVLGGQGTGPADDDLLHEALLKTLGIVRLTTENPGAWARQLLPDVLVLVTSIVARFLPQPSRRLPVVADSAMNTGAHRSGLPEISTSSSSSHESSPLIARRRTGKGVAVRRQGGGTNKKQLVAAVLLLACLAGSGFAEPSLLGVPYVLASLATVLAAAAHFCSLQRATFAVALPTLFYSLLHVLGIYIFNLPIVVIVVKQNLNLQSVFFALGFRFFESTRIDRDWPTLLAYLFIVVLYVVCGFVRYLFGPLYEFDSLFAASRNRRKRKQVPGPAAAAVTASGPHVQRDPISLANLAGNTDNEQDGQTFRKHQKMILIESDDDQDIEESSLPKERHRPIKSAMKNNLKNQTKAVVAFLHPPPWQKFFAQQGARVILFLSLSVCILLPPVNVLGLLVLTWAFVGQFLAARLFVRSVPIPLLLMVVTVAVSYFLATPLPPFHDSLRPSWLSVVGFVLPQPLSLIYYACQFLLFLSLSLYWSTRAVCQSLYESEAQREQERILAEARTTELQRNRSDRDDDVTGQPAAGSEPESSDFSSIMQILMEAWNLVKLLALLAFKHAYLISLAALYIVAVHFAGVMQAVYLVFFVCFLLSERLADRFWVLLVFYVELVILSLLAFQMDWSEPYRSTVWARTLGLRYFDGRVALFVGLAWDLVLFVFVVIQWALNLYFRSRLRHQVLVRTERVKSRQASQTTSRRSSLTIRHLASSLEPDAKTFRTTSAVAAAAAAGNDDGKAANEMFGGDADGIPSSFGLLVYELGRFYVPVVGLVAAYTFVGFICLYELASVRTAVLLLCLLTCLLMHLLFSGFIPTAVRATWLLLVTWSGLSLSAQYVWQLEYFRVLILDQWSAGFPLSPAELGLEVWPEGISTSRVFGTALVFAIAALQRRLMVWHRAAPSHRELLVLRRLQTDNAFYRRFYGITEWFCRLWTIQHPMVLALVLFLASVVPRPYVVTTPFLVTALGVAVWPSRFVGPVGATCTFAFSMVVAVAQLCARFSVFLPWYDADQGRLAMYMGFERVATESQASLRYIACCLAILAARIGRRWLNRVKRDEHWQRRCQVPLFRLIDSNGQEQSAVSAGLLAGSDDGTETGIRSNSEPLAMESNSTSSTLPLPNSGSFKWYVNNFSVLYGPFILLAVWLIAVYLQQATYLGALFLLLLGLFIGLRKADRPGYRGRVALSVVAALAALALLWSVFIFIGPPPHLSSSNSSGSATSPGSGSLWPFSRAVEDVPLRRWLALSVESPSVAFLLSLSFFLLVLFAALQWMVPPSLRTSVLDKQRIDAVNGAWLTAQPRTWFNESRHLLYWSSSFLVLLLVFLAGTAKADLLSLVYVAFALVFLVRDDSITNQSWLGLRWFTFVLLFLKVIYRAPFFPKPPDSVQGSPAQASASFSVQALIGFHADSDGMPFDMAIFFLCTIQLWLMTHVEWRQVKEYRAQVERQKMVRAMDSLRARKQLDQQALLAQGDQTERLKERLIQLQLERNLARVASTSSSSPRQQTSKIVNDVDDEQVQDAEEEEKKEEDEDDEELAVGRPPTDKEKMKSAAGTLVSSTNHMDAAQPNATIATDAATAGRPGSGWLRRTFTRLQSFVVSYPWVERGTGLLELYSQDVCFLAMAIAHAMSADALSAVYLVAAFGFASLIVVPRPGHRFFNAVLAYSCLCMVAKFVYQVSGFCDCNTVSGVTWSISPRCSLEGVANECAYNNNPAFGYPRLLGIYKITEMSYLRAIASDLLVFIAVLWHRRVARFLGVWRISNVDVSSRTKNIDERTGPVSRLSQTALGRDTDMDGNPASMIDRLAPPTDQANDSDNEIEYGEDNNEEESSLTSVWNEIVSFFREIVSLKQPGYDYYPAILLVESVSLLWLMMFPQSFVGLDTQDLVRSLQTSSIPVSFLIVILIQFTWMVIERIMYIQRNMFAKCLIQYVTLLMYIVLLFFYYPVRNEVQFTESTGLLGFYLLKSLYWLLSARQISYGYPSKMQVGGQFLTKSTAVWRYYAFSVYRAVPFVFELRALLDWTLTDTSLIFYEWLKVQDVYAQLFLVACKRSMEQNSGRKPGDKQSLYTKLSSGALLFLLLMVLLWFPLFFFSNASLTSEPNAVVSCRTQFGLNGWDPFYTLSQRAPFGVRSLSDEQFRLLSQQFRFIQPDDNRLMQLITTSPYSDRPFLLSPPSEQSLRSTLENTGSHPEFFLQLQLEMRLPNGSAPVQFAAPVRRLSATEKLELANTFRLGNGDVTLTRCFPRLVRVPVVSVSPPYVPAEVLDKGMVNCTVRLHTKVQQLNGTTEQTPTVSRWFSVEQELESPFNGTGPAGFDIVVQSDPVATGLAGVFATAGVIGLYVTLVLSIGRFLRMYVSGLTLMIPYTEMPSTDRLTSLCDDIFIARESGDFELEELLYRELLEIYRSHERLLLKTKID